jgi:hypothetical protein
MINLKVLSTATAIALVAPMVMPSSSFAQGLKETSRPGGAVRGVGGGAPAPHFNPGGGVHVGGGAPGPRFSGGGGGGVYRGGGYGGGGGYYRHGGGGGFIPGAVAGAIVGGAIASQGYYGSPGYYAPGPGYYPSAPAYYDDSYAEDSVVAAAPAPGGDDSVAYCMQTYRSYNPRTGTYLGNDGFRHPCP